MLRKRVHRTTRHLAAVPAIALTALLAGCATGNSGAAAPPSTTGAAQGAEFNQTDVRFTQMMLPHHMQAVRTAKVQVEKGSDPEVVALAEQILRAQQQEIDQMQGFLETFGVEPMAAAPDKQQRWDENFADMQAASPQEVDMVFLTNMMPHHAAAVPMAQLELEQGSYKPAMQLAMQIKQSQLREIDMMKDMIRARA